MSKKCTVCDKDVTASPAVCGECLEGLKAENERLQESICELVNLGKDIIEGATVFVERYYGLCERIIQFEDTDIGEAVFLTRAEAEKELVYNG